MGSATPKFQAIIKVGDFLYQITTRAFTTAELEIDYE